ncbi:MULTISPECIES: DUF5347 family protein [Xenorhabdus]|uniref:DUF5347 family protein n=1 Tax=Xenorhabdus TaxID=626 RepID=UPI0006498380|nr:MULTISPECIES: DUF5347 family protein [Xenorhabdus]KLU15552.1 hypothetical protein AAY47_10265 [Xenorhabdus griffiniae]KOP34177.1 hypothetical protein AFK69_06045 [Xenorhabdus sp. GDc328]
MANTEPYRAVSLTLDEQINGLNKTAELLAPIVCDIKKSNSQLADFIECMRDRTNNRVMNNEKLLHVMFYLAGFDKSRYNTKVSEFTEEEIRSLIMVMNQFKAVAERIPSKLVMPNLIEH